MLLKTRLIRLKTDQSGPGQPETISEYTMNLGIRQSPSEVPPRLFRQRGALRFKGLAGLPLMIPRL